MEKDMLLIKLVQPNKVTNARYAFTEREENILTLVMDAVQKFITQDPSLQRDLFNQPKIIIDTSLLGDKSKAKYIEASRSLMKKDISFEWKNDSAENVETMTTLISAVHNIKETSKIEITINQWSIPYLLYWGEGVGGTIFNKKIALSIQGEYTKRLYKLCKRWENRGGFVMPLNEFRSMLCIEDKYPELKDIRKRILDPSVIRMKDSADVYFDYSFVKGRGSRQYNLVSFKIYGNNKNIKSPEHKNDMYAIVYSMLCIAYPNYKSNKAQDIADRISLDPDKFEQLYQRMKRLRGEFDVADKDVTDVIKIIKHFLKHDYGIE